MGYWGWLYRQVRGIKRSSIELGIGMWMLLSGFINLLSHDPEIYDIAIILVGALLIPHAVYLYDKGR